MKTRQSILTLAVGASLALGVPIAQATNQLGEGAGSASAKSSSEMSAATLKALRAEYQHIVNSYKKLRVHRTSPTLADFWQMHGPGGVAPGDRVGG